MEEDNQLHFVRLDNLWMTFIALKILIFDGYLVVPLAAIWETAAIQADEPTNWIFAPLGLFTWEWLYLLHLYPRPISNF